jgi:hypothetical protein
MDGRKAVDGILAFLNGNGRNPRNSIRRKKKKQIFEEPKYELLPRQQPYDLLPSKRIK